MLRRTTISTTTLGRRDGWMFVVMGVVIRAESSRDPIVLVVVVVVVLLGYGRRNRRSTCRFIPVTSVYKQISLTQPTNPMGPQRG